jgi:glycosyltransferase involved in cell wall biosynthesis
MVRILYLISLENILGNPIFNNQVRSMQAAIQRENPGEFKLTVLCLLPWLEITRRGIYSNFRRHADAIRLLKTELAREGLELVVAPALLPSAVFNRIGGFLLGWFVISSLPGTWWIAKRRRAKIIHCRYYYSAALANWLIKLLPGGVKVIFDVRSLLPEQGVVNGLWSATSDRFRFWKRTERKLLSGSDLTVAVSEAMAGSLRGEEQAAKLEMIPNFADLNAFRPEPQTRSRVRRELGIEQRSVLVFAGTLGGRYPADRVAEAVERFFSAMGSDSFFLLLSPSDEKRCAPLVERLEKLGRNDKDNWLKLNAAATDVPRYLAAADWSLLVLAGFISSPGAAPRDEYVFPIKFAEYLAMGLPLLTRPENPSIAELVRGYDVGAVLDEDIDPAQLGETLRSSHARWQQNCLRTARENFAMERFADRYAQIYRELDD